MILQLLYKEYLREGVFYNRFLVTFFEKFVFKL